MTDGTYPSCLVNIKGEKTKEKKKSRNYDTV